MTTLAIRPTFTTGTVGLFGGSKDGEKPYIDFTSNESNLNKFEYVPVKVEDMRFMDPKPSFKDCGYEFRSHASVVSGDQLLRGKETPEDKKLVDDYYMTEVVKIIQEATGGAEVVPNGFRLRTQVKDGGDALVSKVSFGSVNAIHVDRDPSNAIFRLKTSVGEERAEELLEKYKGKKWASVNVWRPIGNSVYKWPLLFVNRSKVPEWDYEPYMQKLYTKDDPAVLDRGEKGHEMVLKMDPRYMYHYASHLTENECLVFASFHSDPKKVVPHGAFWDNNTKDDAPTRSSIEARCWVFWNEDQE